MVPVALYMQIVTIDVVLSPRVLCEGQVRKAIGHEFGQSDDYRELRLLARLLGLVVWVPEVY